MKIKLMYKIHGLNTAMGVHRSAGNAVFYETEEAALERAHHYVATGGPNVAMVIYKAHVLVRRNQPPVEVLSVEHDGEIRPFR